MIKPHKLFKDLDYDDWIYYLNPFIGVREMKTPLDLIIQPTIGAVDQFIQGVRVKEVKGITLDMASNALELPGWVQIEYFRPENILHSPEIERIPTIMLWVDGKLDNMIAKVKLEDQVHEFPTIYTTSKEYLKEYVLKSRGL